MRDRNGPGRAGLLLRGLAVAALVLLIVEGGLRLVFGSPSPSIRVTMGLADHESFLVRDGDRVRTTYQAPVVGSFAVDPGGPRVAVLGASSVHGGTPGNGISADDMWQMEFPALLEQITGIPTLNLGQPATSSGYLVSILEELLEYPVSVVVVYAGHCELGNAYFEKRYRGLRGIAIQGHPWLERSQLFVQMRRVLQGSVPATAATDSIPDPPLSSREVETIETEFRANLERIVALGRGAGVRLVLVSPACDLTYPPVFSSGPRGQANYERWQEGMSLRATHPQRARSLLEEARDASLRPVRASTRIEAITREVGEQEGVRLVVAGRSLPQDDHGSIPAPWLFADELHFTLDGHRAMAELLAPVIAQEAGHARLPGLPPPPLHGEAVRGGGDLRAPADAGPPGPVGVTEDPLLAAARAPRELGGTPNNTHMEYVIGEEALRRVASFVADHRIEEGAAAELTRVMEQSETTILELVRQKERGELDEATFRARRDLEQAARRATIDEILGWQRSVSLHERLRGSAEPVEAGLQSN